MVTRKDIRYGNFWVRAVCCLAIGIGLANAAHFGLLDSLEKAIRNVIVSGESELYGQASFPVEVIVLVVASFLVAIPRIERPILLITGGFSLTFLYAFAAVLIPLRWNFIPPAMSPLLGIVIGTAVMQSMAWSEERSRRTELEQLERIRQELADMLVHDLKKRMSAILMSLSLLDKKVPKFETRATELMTTIRSSTERMLLLVSNLLDIRKFEEGGMRLRTEPMDLRAAMTESLNEHQAVADVMGATFHFLNGPEVQVRADRQLFSRVLTNLLWNALQHAPENSVIELGCTAGPEGGGTIHVANRGPVVPASEQERLFRPYVAGQAYALPSHSDSTGLGLSFCKLTMEAHGGTIRLESPWDGHDDGVRVEIFFPASAVSQPRNVS